MSRQQAIILALVLHSAIMLALWLVLRAWVPPFMDSLRDTIGTNSVSVALIALGLFCAYVAYWPRTPDGRARSLLPRRP